MFNIIDYSVSTKSMIVMMVNKKLIETITKPKQRKSKN